MKNNYYTLSFMVISLSIPFCTYTDPVQPNTPPTEQAPKLTPEQFEQLTNNLAQQAKKSCDDKNSAAMQELNKKLDVLIALMLHNAQVEARKTEQALQKEQKLTAAAQAKAAQALEQAQANQELYSWFNNLPKYQKYTVLTYLHVKGYALEQLWPTMKSILTSMLARKLVEIGLSSVDRVTGDLIEKALPGNLSSFVATRPGEWLAMNEEQRKRSQLVRELNRDPEYVELSKQYKKLHQELDPTTVKKQVAEEIRKLMIAQLVDQAKTNNAVYKHKASNLSDLELRYASLIDFNSLVKREKELEALRKAHEEWHNAFIATPAQEVHASSTAQAAPTQSTPTRSQSTSPTAPWRKTSSPQPAAAERRSSTPPRANSPSHQTDLDNAD